MFLVRVNDGQYVVEHVPAERVGASRVPERVAENGYLSLVGRHADTARPDSDALRTDFVSRAERPLVRACRRVSRGTDLEYVLDHSLLKMIHIKDIDV